MKAQGPEGLRVQAIARDVGVTDAAVHHHFGSRDGLGRALLRDAGRRLRDEMARVAAVREDDELPLDALAARIGRVYDDRGYARLTVSLGLLDHPPRGAGMFRAAAESVDAARRRRAARDGAVPPVLDDALLAMAGLSLILWAEPLAARPMLRSVGLPANRRTVARLRRWLVSALDQRLAPGLD